MSDTHTPTEVEEIASAREAEAVETPALFDGGRDVHYTELGLPMNVDAATTQDLLNKLIWSFRLYPFMSHTMIQIAVGTNVPSNLWRPILDAMIVKDFVKSIQIYTQSAAGRSQTVNIFCLAAATYNVELIGIKPLPGTITT